jgi:hypothetical protein
MIKYIIKPFFLLLLFFNFPTAYSQNSFDSSFINAVAVYTKAANANTHLYNGSEYIDYDHRITGDPFFASLYFTDGSVVFDDILYTHVKMFYDILHDDLIIKNYNDTALILVKEKISSFNFANHYFIQLVTNNAETGIKTPGFFEVLYNGNTKLFARRKKEITEKISTQYSESLFTEKNEYFLYNKNNYYPVSDKKSILNILKDRKPDLIKFLHQNKIKFRKNKEAAMIKMVAYYDGLNKPK